MAKQLREAYGESLLKYGGENPKVVVLDADLATSTKSILFGTEYPERFFDCGIAEANMTSMAAGFAASGFVPFINTFATFIGSMCAMSAKAIIAYSDLNVRLIGGNNGVTGGYDGATHHSIDDINVMRGIPGMLVMSPCDPVEVDWMVKTLANEYIGPAYMSVSRQGLGNLYDDNAVFEIGKANTVKPGTDVTVIAYGLSVIRAMRAADILKEKGINIRVIDMFTIKPVDRQAVINAAEETGAIVTAEEHSIIGGVGTAVSEILCEEQINIPFERIGIKDTFTESGSYQELIDKYDIGENAIIHSVENVLARKQNKVDF